MKTRSRIITVALILAAASARAQHTHESNAAALVQQQFDAAWKGATSKLSIEDL
jgi:hypothetical protein